MEIFFILLSVLVAVGAISIVITKGPKGKKFILNEAVPSEMLISSHAAIGMKGRAAKKDRAMKNKSSRKKRAGSGQGNRSQGQNKNFQSAAASGNGPQNQKKNQQNKNNFSEVLTDEVLETAVSADTVDGVEAVEIDQQLGGSPQNRSPQAAQRVAKAPQAHTTGKVKPMVVEEDSIDAYAQYNVEMPRLHSQALGGYDRRQVDDLVSSLLIERERLQSEIRDLQK